MLAALVLLGVLEVSFLDSVPRTTAGTVLEIAGTVSEDGCAVTLEWPGTISLDGRKWSGTAWLEPATYNAVTVRARGAAGEVATGTIDVRCTATLDQLRRELYGPRLKGRRGSVAAKNGGGGPTEAAIQAGLRWLARHQEDGGAWRADGFVTACAAEKPCSGRGYVQFDAGVTGLAVLAFLGAGVIPDDAAGGRTYKDPHTGRALSLERAAAAGVAHLVAIQDEEGCFGRREGEFMYNHAIATAAVAEGFGLTRRPEWRAALARAVAFLAAARNPEAAWRYTPRSGDNDSSITAWAILAAEAARTARVPVPEEMFAGASAWFASVTQPDGTVGYSGWGKFDVVVKGKNEAWGPHRTFCGAVLALHRTYGGIPADLAGRMAGWLAKDLPRWAAPQKSRPIDFYYWHWGTLGLFRHEAPKGERWKAWNAALRAALLPQQATKRDGCAEGSWNPDVDRFFWAGGRPGATAMNALTLETYCK